MHIMDVLRENALLAQMEYTSTKHKKNVFIVGWNSEAAILFDRIISTPALGYYIKGFVRPLGVNGDRHFYRNVPVVGDLHNLSAQIRTHDIKELLIVLSPEEQDHVVDLIKICKRVGIDYNVISAYDTSQLHVTRTVIREVIGNREFGVRRMIDFAGALFLLIFMFPLFLIVSAAIKLESAGPIFYTQVRCGKDGRHFPIFKFRSMVQDAEKLSGPTWAQKHDPRITRVGRFMRKTRIDELPQLLNIMNGDMSFIGPRPERPFFVEQFKKQIPFYINRMKIKPGVTGLAQVTVGYDETLEDVREKIARDCEYIENASSWRMNAKILYKTFIAVLSAQGQ